MQKIPNEPVTEVKIVCQKEKCPGGYYLLEKTVNGHDAQLFESTWRHKGKRFLCYSKQPGSHVIVDMSIINEGDPVTRGYTAITNAFDESSEKAFRKHQLCIRVLPKDQATQAVCDMTLVNKSKGETPPPGYYTITNDVNDLYVCFRMAPVVRYQPPAATGAPYSSQSVGPNRQQWFGQPQAPGPSMPVPWQQQNMQSFPNYTPHHAMPAAKMSAQTGIEGLPFQINNKFDMLWKKSPPNVAAGVPKMSSQDIKLKMAVLSCTYAKCKQGQSKMTIVVLPCCGGRIHEECLLHRLYSKKTLACDCGMSIWPEGAGTTSTPPPGHIAIPLLYHTFEVPWYLAPPAAPNTPFL